MEMVCKSKEIARIVEIVRTRKLSKPQNVNQIKRDNYKK
jgi:hypothetical protein